MEQVTIRDIARKCKVGVVYRIESDEQSSGHQSGNKRDDFKGDC